MAFDEPGATDTPPTTSPSSDSSGAPQARGRTPAATTRAHHAQDHARNIRGILLAQLLLEQFTGHRPATPLIDDIEPTKRNRDLQAAALHDNRKRLRRADGHRETYATTAYE
jgi:hypothetical protein